MVKRVRFNPPTQVPQQGPGRPATYEDRFAAMAEAHCKLGATDADLADLFGVTVMAIKNWMSRHPEFGAAVRHGKAEVFDPKVERSLAQKALGYSVDVEEVKILQSGREVRYTIRKHYPPDTTACIFWLKNRNPQQWRDVQDHRHTGKLELEKLTSEELLDMLKKEAVELGLSTPVSSRVHNGKTKH